MMDRPIVRIAGYVVFGVLVFVIALMVTFPDGAIKQIAAVQIEHQLEKSMRKNYDVEVADLDPWWMGIELEGLSITERRAEAVSASTDEGDKKKGGDSKAEKTATPTRISIPSIGARFAPLGSLVNLSLSAKYHLGLGGGAVSGSFTRGSSSQSLYVSIDDVNLNDTKVLTQLTGVPMFGTLNGEGNFQFMTNRPVVTGGKFDLNGSKVTIGPKKELKLESLPFGHVKIPQMNFGNMKLGMHVEEKKRGRPRLILDEFRSKGRDLQSQLWGHVQLANRISRAEARLKARMRFNPKFVQKTKVIRAMLRHEKFQNGKNGNWHGLVFWGRLSSLQWKGSPTAADGPKKKGGGSAKGSGGSGKNKSGNKKKQ